MNDPFAPWNVNAEEFPTDGASDEKLWFALQYAVLAPSSHNTQPWRFRVTANVVDVLGDFTRRLSITDPDDRQLYLSCGAAVEHLRLALRYFGHECEVEACPEPERPSLVARVTLRFHGDATAEDVILFNAIPKRRTNRLPFLPEPVPELLLRDLAAEALKLGAWLQVAESDEARFALADLVAEGDRQQWQDRRFRAELADWIHPNRGSACDGIPGYAEGLGDLTSNFGPVIIRTFDLGKGQAAKDREIALHSPVLAVLGTAGDDKVSWIAAGRALARVLLRARVEDVWASFLNQPIEIPALRPRVAEAVGRAGAPQLLLRLGFGTDVKPTPRRPVSEVVLRPTRTAVRAV